MLPERLLHGFNGQPVHDAQFMVDFRMQEDRHGICQHDGGQYRFVHVSWDQDFFTWRDGGRDHGHNGRARPLYGEKCIISTKRLRREFLGLFDNPSRFVQVV